MNNTDLVVMIGHLSRSLFPLQHVISGFGYVLGILFYLTALQKLRKIGDHRANSSSQEKIFVPLAYFIGGSFLIFLPSAVSLFANTTFGTGNILQYGKFNPYSIYSSMGLVIRTAGLIWFIRGAVLISHASEPGVKDGLKGLIFLIAGILSINFNNTVAFLTYLMTQITTLTSIVP